MNGEAKALTADVIFPVKPLRKKRVSEVKPIKIEETTETIVETVKKESRFARLKMSLRKRSVSIL